MRTRALDPGSPGSNPSLSRISCQNCSSLTVFGRKAQDRLRRDSGARAGQGERTYIAEAICPLPFHSDQGTEIQTTGVLTSPVSRERISAPRGGFWSLHMHIFLTSPPPLALTPAPEAAESQRLPRCWGTSWTTAWGSADCRRHFTL